MTYNALRPNAAQVTSVQQQAERRLLRSTTLLNRRVIGAEVGRAYPASNR